MPVRILPSGRWRVDFIHPRKPGKRVRKVVPAHYRRTEREALKFEREWFAVCLAYPPTR